MKQKAILRIEFIFGEGLEKSVAQARANGEDHTVESVLDSLVETYSEQIRKTPELTAPLRKLDPNIKVRVSSSKIGE